MTRRFAGTARTLRRLLCGAALAAVAALAAAVPASAAPAWLAPVSLSSPGKDAGNAVVAVDGAGRTVALWERESPGGVSHDVQFAAREPGGSFSAPQDLSLNGSNPEVAISADGTAVAVWRHFVNPPGNYAIESSTRPAGGSFSAPVVVASLPLKAIPNGLEVAINPAGDVGVVWETRDPASDIPQAKCPAPPPVLETDCPNPSFVEAAVRPAGGAFSAPTRISPPRGVAKPDETEGEKNERLVRESALDAGEGRLAIAPSGEAIGIWSYFDGEHEVLQTASRPPGGSWADPASVAGTEGTVREPAIESDGSGDATAVWAGASGEQAAVIVASRPAAGAFGTPEVLSESGAQASEPRLAVGPTGVATVAWLGAAEDSIQAVTRSPSGAFSSPVDVSEPGDLPLFPELATNAAGDTVVAWDGAAAGASRVLEASIRHREGPFSAPREISPASTGPNHVRVAIDGFGDATAVWSGDDGSNTIAQAAGFDAYPPELRDLAIPATGRVGDPVTFSASPFDVWPMPPASFDFGDGSGATGNSISHVYTRPGTYPVTVTATDPAGTRASGGGSITIRPRGEFSLGRLSLNKKKGTGRLAVTVDGPGTVSLAGKGIRAASVRAGAAGPVQVPVKSLGKSAKRLNKSGKLKASLGVTFTPDGGTPLEQRRKVTLLKKHG